MTTYLPSITIPTAVFQNTAASILLPVTLGLAVGYTTGSQTQKTYLSLRQPPMRPPPWLFGPVWTVLYGLMGYAAHRATTAGLSLLASPQQAASAKQGMTLYTIQLALNLAWMPIFFGAHRPLEATVDIVALLGVNGYLTYVWSSVDEVSAWCQVPYLAWLGFATYLSAGVGYLNNWDLKSGQNRKDL
jgi:benzodiazapine receptor